MSGAPVIAVARPDQRDALEALQWRASLANADDRDALLAHPDAIELPLEMIQAGHVLTAELDGVAVGFAAVLTRPDGEAELDSLFVEPVHWKAGIGRALTQACCALARERGARLLHVIGNPHALGFYLACGFERTGAHETRFGLGVLMQKPLI